MRVEFNEVSGPKTGFEWGTTGGKLSEFGAGAGGMDGADPWEGVARSVPRA